MAWSVDKGFGWSTPVTDGESQLHVTIPVGDWTTKAQTSGDYSTRKTWAGLGKVDPTSGQHPLKSLEIYMKKNGDKAEFFGKSDGKWLEESNKGYGQANRMYVVDKGWYTIEKPVDLGFTLTEWYQYLMKKNIG